MRRPWILLLVGSALRSNNASIRKHALVSFLDQVGWVWNIHMFVNFSC